MLLIVNLNYYYFYYFRLHFTDLQDQTRNFCPACFRWIDPLCVVDKHKIVPANPDDLGKFQNISEGEQTDAHLRKCTFKNQKINGKYAIN